MKCHDKLILVNRSHGRECYRLPKGRGLFALLSLVLMFGAACPSWGWAAQGGAHTDQEVSASTDPLKQQEAATAAPQAQSAVSEAIQSGRDEPLPMRTGRYSGSGVRLPLLPNRAIASDPADSFIQHKTKTAEQKGLDKAAGRSGGPSAGDKAAAEAALAAFNAYKKRQLEALESDRKTLTALQTAIQDLGLGKKLDMVAPSVDKMAVVKTPENPVGDVNSQVVVKAPVTNTERVAEAKLDQKVEPKTEKKADLPPAVTETKRPHVLGAKAHKTTNNKATTKKTKDTAKAAH